MLKETCRIYHTGSLSVHTLDSYPLKDSLHILVATVWSKQMINRCYTAVW